MILRHKDFILRNIAQQDKEMIFRWRNLENVRKMMINSNEISLQEHNAWFRSVILKEKNLHYILYYQEKPIGYIGYKIEGEGILSPGLYIGEKINPEAGLYIVAFSIDIGFSILNAKTLKTKIKVENRASVSISKYMGYNLVEYDNKYFLAILNSNEWKHKLGVNFKEEKKYE